MTNNELWGGVELTVDQPEAGMLRLTLEGGGKTLDRLEIAYLHPVDNLLLTAIDNLLNKNRVHKFALKAVQLGQGVDKNSSLYRMVQSFASAIAAAEKQP